MKAAAVSHRLRAGARRGAGPHRPALRRRAVARLLRRARAAAAGAPLELGGGTNTSQTARMLAALEPLLADERPDAVLVYGDTNSTLAGALAGAQAGVPVAHVEAGMRSYDRTMPEELNRVLADHAVRRCCCARPSTPAETLRGERGGRRGRRGRRRDGRRRAAARAAARERTRRSTRSACAPGEYLLATAHRAGNVDDPARLRAARRRCCWRCPRRSCCRCTRARARGWRPPACSSARRRASARAAARLPRVHGAAARTRARC